MGAEPVGGTWVTGAARYPDAMSTPDGELRADAGPDRRRTALLVTAVVLAGLAAAAVVLADDARWLRLGVVAALWAALLAAVVLARRRAAPADTRADDRVEALERRHSRELNRAAEAREEELARVRREVDAQRHDEIAGLREEVARLRTHADAVTVQPVAVRPARLRVVGESAPPPQHAASFASVPQPPVERPRPVHPVPVAAPAPAAVTPPPVPLAPRPAARADWTPRADPSVVAAGSFVDQYVRAAGYEVPGDRAPAPGERGPDPAPPPHGEARERPGGAANRMPGPGWEQGSSATAGRSVAELLARHAAAAGPGGRRRRDER